MASEITIDARLQATKGYLSVDRRIASFKADMSGSLVDGAGQSIGTSAEAVDLSGDVASPGWALFRNLDATNYLEIGIDVAATFYPVAKLEPGEIALFRLGTAALYARANTATCALEKTVLSD